MGWFKDLFFGWKYKNDIIKQNKGISNIDDSVMGWNIYVPENTTRKSFAKQFHKVHGSFKYKFITPILVLAKRFMPKYVHEGVVPINDYNREWVVYEKAYNLALEDWSKYYLFKYNKENNLSDAEVVRRVRENRDNCGYLKTIKQATIYVPMMDSAYHEFGVFLLHRISQGMTKEFSGQTYNRIVYDSNIVNDVHWLILQKQIKTSVECSLFDTKIGGGFEWQTTDVKKKKK